MVATGAANADVVSDGDVLFGQGVLGAGAAVVDVVSEESTISGIKRWNGI